MKCPFCHDDNDRVTDTRTSQDGYVIRRRRECLHCRRRYTTYERMEEPTIKVVKKDGSRVTFEREKIRTGLEKACWKRPVSMEQIDGLVMSVEQEILAGLDQEVESQRLGEMVMKRLRDLDQVAYVRFASVYRDFTDAQDFVREIAPMLKQPRPAPQDGAK
jgi:transcriptional repressor NrdR